MKRTVEQIAEHIVASKKNMDILDAALTDRRMEVRLLDEKWREERAKHDGLLKELHESIYSTVQP